MGHSRVKKQQLGKRKGYVMGNSHMLIRIHFNFCYYVPFRTFMLDIDCVTTEQFQEFVESTKYKTEAELFRWSFVVEMQVSEAIRKEVDGPNGIGRVQ